ncbi:MAG: hypothetical protein ACREFL_08800 [Stellaceae bacterium]
MSGLGLSVQGAETLSARLGQIPAALRAALGPAFADLAAELQSNVSAKLDGAVVTSRSGALAASLFAASDESSAETGVDLGAAPYGAALEFGASIPAQLIAAKNAKALAFVVGGQKMFAKQANRPAFSLPPHSFLRSALAEFEPQAVARLDEAVAEAIAS